MSFVTIVRADWMCIFLFETIRGSSFISSGYQSNSCGRWRCANGSLFFFLDDEGENFINWWQRINEKNLCSDLRERLI